MMIEMGKKARQASFILASLDANKKNQVIGDIADRLEDSVDQLLDRNNVDVQGAGTRGLSQSMIDRLTLTPERILSIAADLRSVAALPDPVGEIFEKQVLPNGLKVQKQRIPIGVLGVIYESRPNVTIDVAGLALKSGNAIILRGGSETIHSNRALVQVIQGALADQGLPPDSVQFIDDPDRARVAELLNLYEYIDLLIPRGGAALHRYCRENSRIPVITGGIGICHLFLDESADLEGALKVIYNAKVQRPTVCNALDTVLVHRNCAQFSIPKIIQELRKAQVGFRVDDTAFPYLNHLRDEPGLGDIQPAGPDDFDTEWLSLVMGIKVVDNLEQAIEHIRIHSTGHSDGILTQNEANAEKFVALVNSAAVYVNASTRFTDGSQLGLGAEVAVSTQPLHARGPMGLRELTTYKWVIIGQNHIRP